MKTQMKDQGEAGHEEIMREIAKQFAPLFEQSAEGIYVYLDEVHKTCNERLARMFGLTVAEWAGMDGFVNKHIAEEDQEPYIRNYQTHVQTLSSPVRFRFRARRKDGSRFNAETDMIPISWGGYALAFHFIREVK